MDVSISLLKYNYFLKFIYCILFDCKMSYIFFIKLTISKIPWRSVLEALCCCVTLKAISNVKEDMTITLRYFFLKVTSWSWVSLVSWINTTEELNNVNSNIIYQTYLYTMYLLMETISQWYHKKQNWCQSFDNRLCIQRHMNVRNRGDNRWNSNSVA